MKVKFCPKCRSTSVEWRDNRLGAGEGNYICLHCGFYNVVFPEIEKSKLVKLQKELLKNSSRNKKVSNKSGD